MKNLYKGKLKLKEISSYSDTLRLIFDENIISIDASCYWRIMSGSKVIYSSTDYFLKNKDSNIFMEIFNELSIELKETVLSKVLLSEDESDLFFYFENNYNIQFFTSSIKYESWNMHIKNKQYVCMGGGVITEWN